MLFLFEGVSSLERLHHFIVSLSGRSIYLFIDKDAKYRDELKKKVPYCTD